MHDASNAIDNYVEKLSRRHKLEDLATFNHYSNKAMTILRNRMTYHKQHVQQNSKPISLDNFRTELNNLHDQFIIAPADKASNNYVFICKKYYAEVLCNELGITVQNSKLLVKGNNVYHIADNLETNILEKHRLCLQKYSLEIDQQNYCLPKLFAVPKLHKNPYKFRFIAGAHSSSFKPASVLLLAILNFLQKHFQNYCRRAQSNNNINLFWSIDNSSQAINMLNNARRNGGVHNFSVADFSTLYTNLPHNVIESCIFTLVELCFKNAGANQITISFDSNQQVRKVWYSYCSNKLSNTHKVFSKEDIKMLVHENIDNSFVKFASFVFKQNVGIPMGSNSSPKLADLTLAVMEFQFLKNINNMQVAQDLKFAVRYIDDILTTNDPKFKDTSKNIYHESLDLTFSAVAQKSCDFLDLHLEVENGLKISVYNKTDAFPFNVHRFGYPASNIPSSTYYHVFGGQILRFARICNNVEAFTNKIEELKNIFMKRNFCGTRLVEVFLKTYSTYPGYFAKHGINDRVHAAMLSSHIFK